MGIFELNMDAEKLQKAQKAFEENDSCYFGSLEELYYAVAIVGMDYQFTYNGYMFFLSCPDRDSVFSISPDLYNKNPVKYNSFDELLDGYKVDGKRLREIILDFCIEYEC